MNNRRKFLIVLGASPLGVPFASMSQQSPVKILRIAYLSQGSELSNGAFLGAFRDGLREFGFVDGKNIIIDARWVGTAAYEFPEIAASLVKTKPDAIVGTCIPSTRAAKNATRTIPVVMSLNGDPVAAGLVASFARPGGNVTGTSTLFELLVPKWLELIREAVPRARTIAVMVNPGSLSDPYFKAQVDTLVSKTGVKVVSAEAQTPAELESAFAAIKKQRADAFIVMAGAFWAGQVQRVVTLASVHQLPGIYCFSEFADAGGLMSYGISFRDYYRNAARYVAQVLKGAKPANLPVEQPTKIEFVINLATATKLGVNIPRPLLVRADRTIE
jgi:putative ABC transport system substrate-binding protein